MNPRRRLLLRAIVLAGIVVFGVLGYLVIEGWSFLDSLYMTVITITTVGYAEVHPLSPAGRAFTVVLIIGGVGAALYVLTAVVRGVLESDIATAWGKRRMKNRISRLKGHFVLCGFGRVGETIADTFHEEGVPFVVIELDPSRVPVLERLDYLYIEGDATRDEVLKEAGIEFARGLVAAVGDDADNTYIALTGRQLRPDLFIEARASTDKAEQKLQRAGANRVVSPNSIGARRMAMLAMRPAVVDFIDNISRRSGLEVLMENVAISQDSSLVNQTVGDVRLCSKANVLAVTRKDGRLVANPAGDERISAGDTLIIIGTGEQLSSLEAICEGVKPHA